MNRKDFKELAEILGCHQEAVTIQMGMGKYPDEHVEMSAKLQDAIANLCKRQNCLFNAEKFDKAIHEARDKYFIEHKNDYKLYLDE